MKQNFQFLFLSLFLVVFGIGCADYHTRMGDHNFDHYAFSKAIDHYEKALTNKETAHILLRLADSYGKINHIERAQPLLERIIELDHAQPEHKLDYALTLVEHGQYEEAIYWMEEYIDHVPHHAHMLDFHSPCEELSEAEADSLPYKIEILPSPVNGLESNFSPAYFKDGFAFVSGRNERALIPKDWWTGGNYLDLFYTYVTKKGNWENPISLGNDLNSLYHEGPMAFSSDFKRIYFTRSNYHKGDLGLSDDGVNHLKIYTAELIEGEWENVHELWFNDEHYSIGHPAVSPDGNLLYFISDMPGGYGGTDIYVVDIYGPENYGHPLNLGPMINTAGNELNPFIAFNNDLFFSSDGFPGKGGLDIFKITPNGNTWFPPIHLGCPINSSRDDFGMITSPDGSTGYFSSARTTKTGLDHIFKFDYSPPKYYYKGIVLNKSNKEPVVGSQVVLVNEGGDTIRSLFTGPDGRFLFEPTEDMEDVIVQASEKFHFSNEKTVSPKGWDRSKSFFVRLILDSIVIDRPIVLRNIYYDYNKWDIREDAKPELNRLIKILDNNPDISIEIMSHCDSRGSYEFNEELSNKRAAGVIAYIIENSVASERLSSKSLGERMLSNFCTDQVECSEYEHQQNRRTEFKVIKIEDEAPLGSR